MGCEVRLLGPVALFQGDEVAVGGPHQQVLVAALALSAGRAVSTDRLVDLIWGDDPPDTARRTVQAHVSRLRSAMADPAAIRSSAGGYSMDVDRADVDLLVYHDEATSALGSIESAPSKAAAELELLERRWAEPLGGIRMSVGMSTVLAPFGALRVQAIEGLAIAQIDSGDAGAAVRSLRAMAGEHPTDERLWFQLARAFVALDRRHDALDAIRKARHTLREELGIDLGMRLAQYEVEILDGVAVDSPSAPPSALRTDNLPREADALVERPEVDRVAALLDAGQIITLVGPGGIGKSRCALTVGRQSLDSGAWSDGVWFVDLATLPTGSDDVASAISAAIGLSSQGSAHAIDSVTSYLDARALLLILDNCEHVIDGVRHVAAHLFEQSLSVGILTTSRVRLGISAERVVLLDPLSPDESLRLIEARIAEAGAGPFAREHNIELCEALDHFPLAIELAAARTRSLAPEEITERLATHPELTERPSISNPSSLSGQGGGDRHRSLAAALDWSLDQLDRPVRSTLQRSTVFPVDFDVAAVESVLVVDGRTASEVLDDIAVLVEHHLLVRDHRNHRFRLLQPIRQTLALSAERPGEIGRRHAEHYADVAQQIGKEMWGPNEAATWKVLHAERAHLAEAVRWAAGCGDAQLLERLMEPLSLLPPLASFTEPGEWAEDAMQRIGLDPAEIPTTALAAAGMWAHVERLDECDRLLDELDDRLTDPALRSILTCVRMHRDPATAESRADLLRRDATEAGIPILVGYALLRGMHPDVVSYADSLGCPSLQAHARGFAFLAGRFESSSDAIELLEEMYRIVVTSDSTFATASAQVLLASGLCMHGQRERGASLQVEAIERFVRLRSPQMVWTAVETTANVLAFADADPYATAVLWAATDRTPNPPIGRVLRLNTDLPIRVRAKLDTDQWNAAQREGASLSMDAAANLARKSAERLAGASIDS